MFSKKNFPVEKIEDKLEKFLIHYEFKYDKNRADTGSVYFEIYDPDLESEILSLKIRVSDHHSVYDCDYSISPNENTYNHVINEIKKYFRINRKVSVFDVNKIKNYDKFTVYACNDKFPIKYGRISFHSEDKEIYMVDLSEYSTKKIMNKLNIYYDWHEINKYFDFNKEFKNNIININQLYKCIKNHYSHIVSK